MAGLDLEGLYAQAVTALQLQDSSAGATSHEGEEQKEGGRPSSSAGATSHEDEEEEEQPQQGQQPTSAPPLLDPLGYRARFEAAARGVGAYLRVRGAKRKRSRASGSRYFS